MSKFFEDLETEMRRMVAQGATEFTNGLWNGNAFVPYGPGQNSNNFQPEAPSPQLEQQAPEMPQQERDGREM